METPSTALIRELFPFAKTNKKHYTDCKRGFAQKNTLHPQFTPRGEVGDKTHNYAKVDGITTQRNFSSCFQLIFWEKRNRRQGVLFAESLQRALQLDGGSNRI